MFGCSILWPISETQSHLRNQAELESGRNSICAEEIHQSVATKDCNPARVTAHKIHLLWSLMFFSHLFTSFNSFCTYEIIDVLSITQFSWILELVDSIMHGFEFQPVLAHTLSICTKGTYDSSFWSHKSNSIRHWVTLQLRKLSHRSLSRNVMLCTTDTVEGDRHVWCSPPNASACKKLKMLQGKENKECKWPVQDW